MTSEVMFRRGERPTILKYIIKASDIVGQVYSPIMLLAQINMFPYFFRATSSLQQIKKTAPLFSSTFLKLR